uniref:Uncharacterized protein n=1 Tax=Romanomermis culicivorax TaxID=13658 RepID=A0A915K1P9_ROMCU
MTKLHSGVPNINLHVACKTFALSIYLFRQGGDATKIIQEGGDTTKIVEEGSNATKIVEDGGNATLAKYKLLLRALATRQEKKQKKDL